MNDQFRTVAVILTLVGLVASVGVSVVATTSTGIARTDATPSVAIAVATSAEPSPAALPAVLHSILRTEMPSPSIVPRGVLVRDGVAGLDPSYSLPVGTDPISAVPDPSNGFLYVLNAGSNNVTVINGTKIIASINVGVEPFFGMYDPTNGFVYVSNLLSANVSVLDNTTLDATLDVGSLPAQGAYMTTSQEMLIPNIGSDNVSVIWGNGVLGSVPVGTLPTSITYDPVDDDAYVSNAGSSNVTALCPADGLPYVCIPSIPVGNSPEFGAVSSDGTVYVPNMVSDNVSEISPLDGGTVIGSVKVGSDPILATFDNASGDVYVTNSASDNVSVIHGTALVATLPVGASPTWATYDSENGYVYVSNHASDNLSVLSGVSIVGSVAVGESPELLAFDSNDTYVYVPNAASDNVTIVGVTKYAVTIPSSSAGLPPDQSWGLSVGGTDSTTTAGAPTTVPLPNGTYSYLIHGPAGYQVSGAPPVGNLTVHGSTVTINGHPVSAISFAKGTTPSILFSRSTLPTGGKWCVSVWAWGACSSAATITLPDLTPARYPYTVWTITDYSVSVRLNGHPAPTSGSVVLGKKSVHLSVKLTQIDYAVTFVESGLPVGTHWTLKVRGEIKGKFRTEKGGSRTSTAVVRLPDGTFTFNASAIKGYVTPGEGTVTIHGAPAKVEVTYTVATVDLPSRTPSNALPPLAVPSALRSIVALGRVRA